MKMYSTILKIVQNQCMFYYLMPRKHSIKLHLMFYLMKYVIVLVCRKITKLLYYMYTNQQCSVRWGYEYSDYFNVSSGVKQGGVISPVLFSCYIDKLFSQLENSGLGCHVGVLHAGAFGYADNIALVAPSLQSLRKMIGICEQYAKTHSVTFNPNKSKLLCYNVDKAVDIPPLSLKGEVIPSVGSDKHLGSCISTNIADTNIVDSRGVPRIWEGGGQEFFFQIWEFACREATCCAWRSHAHC